MMRQKEKEQRNRMGADESSIGREAETIYRDARGMILLIDILYIRQFVGMFYSYLIRIAISFHVE